MTPNRRTDLLQRAVTVVAISVNLLVAFTLHTPRTVWWWVSVGCAGWLVGMQVWVERAKVRRHRDQQRVRWELAAATPDPIAALAQMGYMDTLTLRQVEELRDWFTNPPQEVHEDDLPPVVRGLLEVLANPPREDR